jgi:hypothetical protein
MACQLIYSSPMTVLRFRTYSYDVPLSYTAVAMRIVEKVDQLISVCAQLKDQLTSMRTVSSNLLDVVLNEPLTPVEMETK